MPVHFSSLILKMSMFTVVTSCLTTFNLSWFMDLTFQVPMQYCSLQHQSLLPSAVTPRTGRCVCFGSISSFFLVLFLHSSPVAYHAPTNLGSSSFSVIEVIKSRVKWAQGRSWYGEAGPGLQGLGGHNWALVSSLRARGKSQKDSRQWLGGGNERKR